MGVSGGLCLGGQAISFPIFQALVREGLQKKSRTWDIVQQGGGGPEPRIQCPNLFKCSDTKNLAKMICQPQIIKFENPVKKVHLRMS